MRINFDFTDLEAFLAVMETGSFHVASERLNLSQSSITRRVQKLETALRSTLFERTTRDVRPTLAAKRLQQRAEAILDEVKETARAMQDESAAFAHQRAQSVTVATIPTVVSGLIAPALRKFSDELPGARVRLRDLAANEVAEAVAAGEVDFGICSIPLLEPATEFELLFNDPMVLALNPEHKFCQRVEIAWTDLAGEGLILPAQGTGNRLLIDEALARTKLPLRWTYEVGRSTTALDLVAAGVGVAPLPLSAMEQRQGVVWRQMKSPEISRPIGLLRRAGQRESAAAAALIKHIVASGAELVGGGTA